jgi:hypothetical protein
MRNKMIRNRRKSGDSVGASVDTHLDEVVTPLGVTFSQHLVEGEVLPDLPTLFRILRRMLAAAVNDLVTAGSRHLREIDSEIKLRQRRDELVSLLGTKVRGLRNALEGLLGPGSALQLAGIDGRVEVEPVALLAQVEDVMERFGDPELQLEPPGFSTLDRAGVVADFQPDYQELKDVVAELNRENRRSDTTIIAKNEAISRYDLQFRWIAGCLESFYHLAEQHELAERVKPSTRRSGRTEADVEGEEPDGSDEPPDGSPPPPVGPGEEREPAQPAAVG